MERREYRISIKTSTAHHYCYDSTHYVEAVWVWFECLSVNNASKWGHTIHYWYHNK